MPWSLVLLLGGGFALAKATQVSGLSAWMGAQLAVLDFLDARLLVLIVIVATSFATEVTSNVATCSILLPVLRDLVSNGAPLVNALLQFASRNNQAACCARAHNLSCLFFVHLMLREREGGREGRGRGHPPRLRGLRPSFPPSSSALLEESQQRMTTGGGGGGTRRLEQMNCDAPSELAPSKIRYLKFWHVIDLINCIDGFCLIDS